jgi:hypothetical protein
MFLAQDRKWFVDQFPAVHTAIELKFGPSPIKISHVTDGTDQVGRGVFRSFALSDLVPFGGGIVRIQSALLSLEGTNYIKQGIGILKDFSSLVAAPLGQTLTIAEKVGTGMQNLLRGASGAMVLGFHREYAADGGGGSVLKPGYTALILATQAQVDQNRLSVKNSQLLYAGQDGTAKPLDGYNYMLLRVEGRRERDNWRLPNIEEPLNQAIQATIQGDTEKADGFLKAALLVVWQSPDLAVQDRRRVADAIRKELEEIGGGGLGAAAGEVRSLSEIMMARAQPVARALQEPPLSVEEIISG